LTVPGGEPSRRRARPWRRPCGPTPAMRTRSTTSPSSRTAWATSRAPTGSGPDTWPWTPPATGPEEPAAGSSFTSSVRKGQGGDARCRQDQRRTPANRNPAGHHVRGRI